ncbi:MAG: 30S ribosomal protein S12 [DPANN group archaeon]|nr:30S ribosomal protein S12 [DPANN group archaeon]
MPGEFAARKLTKDRQHFRWHSPKYVNFMRKRIGRAPDPLRGSPQARGIVTEKVGREQKQPSSGIIKCVRVQLVKNGIPVTAFLPGDGAVKFVDEHDEVHIEGLGGSKGGPIGSMWGVSYKVTKVNGISLDQLRRGKKEKPKR